MNNVNVSVITFPPMELEVVLDCIVCMSKIIMIQQTSVMFVHKTLSYFFDCDLVTGPKCVGDGLVDFSSVLAAF